MVSAILLVLAIASPAQQAKQAYEKALKFSNAGEYEAALPYFQQAYDLSNHRPSTIIALAQCERELKLYEQAILHFREYLALKPKPKDSSKVEETVALLEDLRDEELAKKEREKDRATAQAKLETKQETGQAKRETGQAKETTQIAELQSIAPPPPPLVAEAQPEAEPGSIWESPVFWGVTAGVVVAVAAGVTLGVVLQPDAEIYGGTTGVVLEK